MLTGRPLPLWHYASIVDQDITGLQASITPHHTTEHLRYLQHNGAHLTCADQEANVGCIAE